MEIIQQVLGIVSSILGLIVTLGVIICTTIPNIRKKIVDKFIKEQEIAEMLRAQAEERKILKAELELSKEADLCLVRDKITRIYYKNLKNKTIKAYDLENLTKLFSVYEKLGGNSYVQQIYKVITEDWEIIQ